METGEDEEISMLDMEMAMEKMAHWKALRGGDEMSIEMMKAGELVGYQ